MKERPIIFSGEMVRAILEGRKTQTRRVIKPQPSGDVGAWPYDDHRENWLVCPYGSQECRLWVRETWRPFVLGSRFNQEVDIEYRADGQKILHHPISSEKLEKWEGGFSDCSWKPSIHMPRWASRITLEITDVRVERVQDITDADAVAEGIDPEEDKYDGHQVPKVNFSFLWDSINEKRGFGWDANPWVWVVEFKKVKP